MFVRMRISQKPRIFLRDPGMLAREVVVEFVSKFVLELSRFFYSFDLLAQEVNMRRYFATKRFCLFDVNTCLFELSFALDFFVLVELKTKSVFHHFAAFFRRSVQDPVCFALRDYLVTRSANICSGEKSNNVLEPH